MKKNQTQSILHTETPFPNLIQCLNLNSFLSQLTFYYSLHPGEDDDAGSVFLTESNKDCLPDVHIFPGTRKEILGSQFTSVQSLDWLGCWGDKRDDSAETFFQSLVQEALVSSSGTGRYVHSLKCWMDSIKEWTGQSTLDNHIVTELMNKDSKHSRQFTFNWKRQSVLCLIFLICVATTHHLTEVDKSVKTIRSSWFWHTCDLEIRSRS